MKRIHFPSFGSFFVVRMLVVMLLPWSTSCDLSLGLEGDLDLEYRDVTVNLTGTAVAANDGTPLPGVTVELAGLGFATHVVPGADTDVTDLLGHYSLTIVTRCLDLGSLLCTGPRLVAHLEGYERGFEPREQGVGRMKASEPVLNATLDFSLRSTRPITVTVHGQVTSSPGGPIAGARIRVHDSPWGFFFDMPVDTTVADSLGMYRIVTTDLCAMSDDSCFVSLSVWAETANRLESRSFNNVSVSGDSLVLSANFQNLQ